MIDYKAYAEANGILYSPFTSHKITVKDIEAIAQAQNVSFQSGDVFIIRTGYTEELGVLPAEEQAKVLGGHHCVGVAGSEATAKWFWNKGFSAVAGDQIAFEVIPPPKDGVDEAGVASDEGKQYTSMISETEVNNGSSTSIFSIILRSPYW